MLGYLALVLHAHLPFVRHPEYENSLEENWLFEAITETYVPLLQVLEGLVADGVDFRLTLSLSPTLAAMLGDPLLQARYLRKLEQGIELASKEIVRTAAEPQFQPLARMYHQILTRIRESYIERYDSNLLGAFERFQEAGKLEILTSAATHGFLPLLGVNEAAVQAQVGVGVESYRQIFGRGPRGFWLPECGYYPGVDRILREHGIRHTILESHGITRADARPHHGVYAPIVTPSGLAAFGRDPDSSRQVWSSVVGYPGDFDYREFYRDIGHDLDLDYIGPYIQPGGLRVDTGLKYYRITGKGNHKEPYVPEWAEQKAARQAEHFLGERMQQVRGLAAQMDRKPIVVAPFDAELFGHWWFEGPRWLDYLIRKIAFDQDTIRLTTLSEYLDEYPANQQATPSLSSWGRDGFNDVWLNGDNDWIYRHLHHGAEVMESLCTAYGKTAGDNAHALDQAGRELLLAQASDWAFMINSGTMAQYATLRTKSHLSRLHRLGKQMESGNVDEAWLAEIEKQDNLFEHIPVAAYYRRTLPASSDHTAPGGITAPRFTGPLRIVMACPEIFPFAKTGGLADMVPSLARALHGLGHDLSLIMPAYPTVFEAGMALRETGLKVRVAIGARMEEGTVLATSIERGLPIYFLRADRYFDRPQLYGGPEGDYPDNAERFVFFARGVLELLRQIGAPDILHAHDWQAALSIAFLRAQPERYPGLSAARTVLTVHNLGYQGLFTPHAWGLLDLDDGLFTPRHLEFYGNLNFLKGGMAFADAISTVSPSYSHEIQTQEHGFGLDGFLEARGGHVVGILNGADYGIWNPRTDRFAPARFDAKDLAGKAICKAQLQQHFGLAIDPDIPVLAMVSRLAAQKGFDLVEAIIEELFEREIQLVVLGDGDRRYQELFGRLSGRFPKQFGAQLGFDNALAHQMEAGADMFLMPSRYEPCGLNQLYSLKYGTIPIVRATGGLKDSVEEFDPATAKGTGFLFEEYEAAALLSAIDRALAAFHSKNQWAALMQNAMAADFSWAHSAQEYIHLYKNLIEHGRPT